MFLFCSLPIATLVKEHIPIVEGVFVRITAARQNEGGPEAGLAGPVRPPADSASGMVSLRCRMELALFLRGRDADAVPAARATVAPEEWIAIACDGVIDIAAALFGVCGRELRSPGRSALAVSRVRQIAMYVAHVTLRLSMREVGQGFGRDRTTVLHACHLIEDLREDDEFEAIVMRVEQVVTAAFGIRAVRG